MVISFDGLTSGELNGQDDWVCNTTGIFTVQTTVVYAGAKAVSAITTGSGSKTAKHPLVSSTENIVSCYFRTTSAADSVYVILTESGSGKMYVKSDGSGNIQIYDGGGTGYQTITSHSADTWYKVEIEFDQTNQSNKYRARINGGSWSSWYTVAGSTYTVIDGITIEQNSSIATAYFDEISYTVVGGNTSKFFQLF